MAFSHGSARLVSLLGPRRLSSDWMAAAEAHAGRGGENASSHAQAHSGTLGRWPSGRRWGLESALRAYGLGQKRRNPRKWSILGLVRLVRGSLRAGNRPSPPRADPSAPAPLWRSRRARCRWSSPLGRRNWRDPLWWGHGSGPFPVGWTNGRGPKPQ